MTSNSKRSRIEFDWSRFPILTLCIGGTIALIILILQWQTNMIDTHPKRFLAMFALGIAGSAVGWIGDRMF